MLWQSPPYLFSECDSSSMSITKLTIGSAVCSLLNEGFITGQKKIWKFLVFILLSSTSVQAASGLEPRDSLFAVLDLDTSIVATEEENKSMTRFRLDFGYDQTFSKFFGDRDLHLHASYSFRYGPSASDFIGDIQGVSNIDDDEYNKLYEIFLGTNLFSWFDIKIGTMDAANDFAAPENGSQFINGPAGSSPTILGISTFPTPTLGVLIHTEFDNLDLKIGRYSGETNRMSFGDTFSIAELGLPIKDNAVLRFGFWRHTEQSKIDGASGAVRDFYGVLDYDFTENISGFFQYGTVDPSFSGIERHWAFGLTSAFVNSGEMVGGIMASHTKLRGETEELLYELFVLFPLKERLSIKPSLTLIRRPFGDIESPNAIAFNVRLNLSL